MSTGRRRQDAAPSQRNGNGSTAPQASGSNDARSLLQLVRAHQRSHVDGTLDATSVPRCRAMLIKLKKLIPKLLRPISTVASSVAVDMLNDLCELLQLLIHAHACPHATAIFVDESRGEDGDDKRGPATANQGVVTQSFPTIATILLYLVSFFCNERLLEAQASVLDVVVQLAVLLQSRDGYASLHFFRDSVELLEDCVLLEECLRRSDVDADAKSASVACYLNTAIHTFHGSDGPLASSSSLILCGCVAIKDGSAVHARKAQLKSMLPALHISGYGEVIVLRRSIELLVTELLRAMGPHASLDRACQRLCLLVKPLIDLDADMVSSIEQVSVVNGASKREKLEVCEATCELVRVLLSSNCRNERSFLIVADAFIRRGSCFARIREIAEVLNLILHQIAEGIADKLSSLGREELWPSITQWHCEMAACLADVSDADTPTMNPRFVSASLRMYEAMMDTHITPVWYAVDLLRLLEGQLLDEEAQAIAIGIIHAFISVQSRFARFLQIFSKKIIQKQHSLGQESSHGGRKRKRSPDIGANSLPPSPRYVDQCCEAISSYLLDLVFDRRAKLNELQAMVLALRILLPLRPLADRISRVESQSLIRIIMQRVEEVVRSSETCDQGVSSTTFTDLFVILLTHLTEHEVGRFRTFIEGAMSSWGAEGIQDPTDLAEPTTSACFFQMVDDHHALRDVQAEWTQANVADWLRRCDNFVNSVFELATVPRRLFLAVLIWKHHRSFSLRVGNWLETAPGQILNRMSKAPGMSSATRAAVIAIVPMILVFLEHTLGDAETSIRLVRSVFELIQDVQVSSPREDPTLAEACHDAMSRCICLAASPGVNHDDFLEWRSSRTSCCPSTRNGSCAATGLDVDTMQVAFGWFTQMSGSSERIHANSLLGLAGTLLRHTRIDEPGDVARSIVDTIFRGITDEDKRDRRIAVRNLRLCIDHPACFESLLDVDGHPSGTPPTEHVNEAISRAVKSRDFLLLESCIEAIGAICWATRIADTNCRELLVWGLLQLLFLWINTNESQSAVSTAVHDQIRRIFSRHGISWKTLFATYPDDLYYPVVNALLRAKCLTAFSQTFFGSHFDEAVLLRDSAAHVLPHYVVNQDGAMIRRFVEAYNGDAGEGDVDMEGGMSEQYPASTTAEDLLHDNIEYVLKELIMHQVEADNNDNRIKEWEFLFQFFPENISMTDVITHSPLRLLNLLAWELGGERSILARKAFREISEYLSEGKDASKGDIDAALVMPRQYFLALMTDLGHRISAQGSTSNLVHQIRAIRSIHHLFGMFEAQDDGESEAVKGALDPFVPKVMAILKVGLHNGQLQEHAINAWAAFVRMLTAKALESNLVSIVVSVLPCIARSSLFIHGDDDGRDGVWCLKLINEENPAIARHGSAQGLVCNKASTSTAIDILKYLFVERRSELKQAFPKVRLIPSIPLLDDVYASYIAEVGDPNQQLLGDILRSCLPYVNHWDSGVREVVLQELHHLLVTRAIELRQLMQAEGDYVDPAVLDILFAIIHVAKTDAAEGIRLLCAQCLGALGAIDGARIPLRILHSSTSGVSTSKDRSDLRLEYSTKDLACVLIETWLVKELRAAPENTDSVAFSIQELLKFVADLSADPQNGGQNVEAGTSTSGRHSKKPKTTPMPDWLKRRFERKDVLEFVEPYWYTNYTITNKRKSKMNSSATFYEKFSTTYEEWLQGWCRRLIELSQPPERNIFEACDMVLSTSTQVGRFVLPYLIQNVLRSGRPNVYEEVKREVLAVLKDDGVMDDLSKRAVRDPAANQAGGGYVNDAQERAFGEYASRHHQCAQTIVSTIDELNEWVWSNEKKRFALSAPASRSVPSTPARTGDVPSDLDDQEKENLEEFLKDIPSQALSNAAFRIKAYARALQYFEVYLRQQPPPPKKETNNTSTLLNTLPVDLALVSKHASYLQQLYSRVDEPDALTGLATLRRLYDAQRHSEPASERAGDEVEEPTSSLTYLLHQVVDHEQLAQWEDALACYEQAIQEVHSAEATHGFYSGDIAGAEDEAHFDQVVDLGVARDPRAVKPALYSGIVQCLIQLGRLESALQHINGIVTQEPQFVGTLYPHALECAWRLSRWDLVSELLNTERQTSLLSNSLVQSGVSSRLRNLDVSQLSLVRVLHSFHEGDRVAFMKNLREARSEIMGPFAAACAESYQRAYPLLHKLHFLHEAEQGFISLLASKDKESQAREIRWKEQCPWDARYDILSASLKFRDPVLALRRVMLLEADLNSEVSHNWLSYAKIARKEGYIRTANSAVMHAESFDNPYASLEKAKLMVAQDRIYEALQILEPVDIDASKLDFKVEDPHYCAKNLLLATNWMQESGQRQGRKVIERYQAVIKFDPTWEKGYFFLAKYYEYLLSVSHPEAPTAMSASSSTRNDDAAVNVDATFHSHLVSLMKNYVLALSHGTKHVFQSMPRLLTLWFEYGELLQPGANKGNSVNKAMRSIEIELSQTSTEQQILSDITRIIQNATEMLPAYEWLVCFPQVTSRICHPNPVVVDGVKKIMMKVLTAYPTQAMWPLLGLSRSLNSQRRNRARDIIAATQRHFMSAGEREIADSFGEGMRLAEELISLAGHDPLNQRKIHIRLSRIRTKILVPVQAGLNTVLPSSGLAPSDDRHAAFMPHSQVYIKTFSDKADVMMTKEKPKRIEVLGTDGQLYPFLCKREKTGDLRKDARMMEFNTMINKLLQKDREGRKRKLRLRTYAVVCLNEESGLMEWVRHTKAMRQLIGQIHKTERGFIQPVRLTHDIKERFLGMQKKFANNPTMMALCFRHKILSLPVFTPRFHQWFTNNFTDPTAWFEARLAFSRSAAVWSMVGHIIGLGDRHGENILIDTTNGECVHVDFDCLFDKGLKLAKPEIVPFRLTPNIIDAFGITGYEGVFRRVCEVTMELLRDNKETLRSVLESFIHDPLVEWGRRGKNAQGMATSTNGRSIADIPSDRSKEETRVILKTIDDRLSGIYNLGDAIRPLVSSSHRSLLPENETLPLSVQGQVDKLIHEATSHENLAQMYIGWMPFL